MNTFSLIYSYFRYRPIPTILNIFAVAVGTALVLTILIINSGLNQGITNQGSGYDLVVGAEGSPSQLLLSTLFHYEKPIGNIPHEVYLDIKENPKVNKAVPLLLGDNYNGFRIIGTTYEYFEDYSFKEVIDEITWDAGEAILGSVAAQVTGLSLGDTFKGVHGLTSGDDDHVHDFEYTVIGILESTGGGDDLSILTPVESVWLVHDDCDHDDHAHDDHHHDDHAHDDHHHDDHAHDDHHHDDHAHDDHHHDDHAHDDHHHDDHAHDDHHHDDHAHDDHHHDDHAHDDHHHDDHAHDDCAHDDCAHDDHAHDDCAHDDCAHDDHAHDDCAHDDHDDHHQHHDHDDEREVTAILLKLNDEELIGQVEIKNYLDEKTGVQAVHTAEVLRQLLSTLGNGAIVANLLAYTAMFLAGISVLISLLSSVTERRKDAAIYRVLGARKEIVLKIVVLEALTLTVIGTIFGVLSAHIISYFVSEWIAFTAGVRISAFAVAPGEIVSVIAILLIGIIVGVLSGLSIYKTQPTKFLQ
ncbi:ABC transporter permease [Candidatus Contubernalis alkaliaceticus]|uniref:ABC transporter permease n=1 Tax=Candidatus Contubernalis alkaliaceticus TaxID=338645 RepID=UPI001F4BD8CC|nr:ABC transporter permease [Candidatus Contubernalis alkalaceticus]UNC92919.1 ABC transporter permease [Candidatus Contubernalis alkalaceticus]